MSHKSTPNTAFQNMNARSIKAEPPPLYFRLEQIDGKLSTRQIAYLTKSDVAKLLHISERAVYDYINRSENPLPHYRLPGGRALLFRPDEVERWLEQSQNATIE